MKKSSLIFTFLYLAIAANSHYCMGAEEENKEADYENQQELEEIWSASPYSDLEHTTHNHKHFGGKNVTRRMKRTAIQRQQRAQYFHARNPDVPSIEKDTIINGTPTGDGVWVRKYNHPVGVTRGKPTEFVRVESNGHSYHSRPFTPEKAKNIRGLTEGRLTPLKRKLLPALTKQAAKQKSKKNKNRRNKR